MRALVLAAAIAAFSAQGFAQQTDARKVDAEGKCHTAGGKPAKASLCKPHKSANDDGMKAQPLKCRDVRNGNPAKCGGAYAVPSPVN